MCLLCDSFNYNIEFIQVLELEEIFFIIFKIYDYSSTDMSLFYSKHS